jgi:hypothetical protein
MDQKTNEYNDKFIHGLIHKTMTTVGKLHLQGISDRFQNNEFGKEISLFTNLFPINLSYTWLIFTSCFISGW